eukprot:2575778-Amphidinium_carterae.1
MVATGRRGRQLSSPNHRCKSLRQNVRLAKPYRWQMRRAYYIQRLSWKKVEGLFSSVGGARVS